MMVLEPKANVYWIGEIESDVRKTIYKWGKFIESQIPEAEQCTMIYDLERDEKWKINGRKKLKDKKLK